MGEKTLNITSTKDFKGDIQVHGNPDLWECICKASSKSQGWMKSTKVLKLKKGCLVQVTTQQKNPDGSYAVSEAVTYCPEHIEV
jgi:hypothetical protein